MPCGTTTQWQPRILASPPLASAENTPCGPPSKLSSSPAISALRANWSSLNCEISSLRPCLAAKSRVDTIMKIPASDLALIRPCFQTLSWEPAGADSRLHLDGQATRSCVTPLSAVGNAKIVTLAGLGTPEKPHPLQTAYVEEQVPQCGYCINGWIMTAASFLATKKKPSEDEIKEALTGLKCRCGTHISILKAVKRAATMMG